MQGPEVVGQSNVGDSRRKQGICLRTNPVLQNRIDSLHAEDASDTSGAGAVPNRSSTIGAQRQSSRKLVDDGNLSLRSRQSCEFITFKGLPIVPPTVEHKVDQIELTRKFNDDDFHIVPLDCSGFKGDKQQESSLVTLNISNNNNNNNGTHINEEVGGKSLAEGKDQKPEARNFTHAPPFRFAGILGGITASFLFAVSVLCVKLMPNSDNMVERTKAMWWRGLFLAIFCSISILSQRSTFKVPRDEILVNFIRSTVGYFGGYGAYLSLQYITMGESMAIIYSAAIWTSLLGYFLLNEPLPLTLTIVFPLGLIGILLIAHPDLLLGLLVIENEVLPELERHHHTIALNDSFAIIPHHINQTSYIFSHPNRTTQQSASVVQDAMIYVNGTNSMQLMDMNMEDLIADVNPDIAVELYFEHRWPGILLALMTSIVSAIVFITLKYRKKTSIQTCTFYLGLTTVIISTIIQCFIGFGTFPNTLVEWSLLLGIGCFSYLGQYVLQWSFKYEKAGVLSVLKAVDIVIAFTFSVIFLDEDILWTSIVGALVIILIVAILMFNEHIERFLCSRCKK